ncbi:hypothetical protein FSP39_000823 [Pinctada imbricata]|uniref:Novel STAND NTPase 3 domain-containing protein n=1 Tax=Pinctada imbricata TaxID=66713 RepID=A0AA88YMQ4_PINIB|nr:hypothetical protein FSP39_000823 [Pinctada imbricata]
MLKGECTTYMLNKTKKCLQDSSNVFIVGKPGSGKTTLAWTVCKESHGVIFKNRKWYVTLSTEKRTLPENCEVLLLLDGAFENPKATEDVLNRVKEFKNQLQSQQLLIIATISHHAYKKIKEQKCINDLNPLEVIDLDDKNNLMTRMEMSAVFMSHGITIRNRTKDNESEARIINESQVDSVYNRFNPTLFKRILTPPLLGFPLIATLMALKPAFLGNIDFVQSPIQYVISSINELKSREKEDKNRYCTIVYAALFDGYLNTNDVKQDVLKAIGDSHGNPEAEINTEFYVLRERSSGMYEFIHESIFHAFLAQYSYRH